MQERKSAQGEWSRRWTFILAATGAAIGLGNIWKFPYVTGNNGGGIFVLLYLICVLLVGIPLLMTEITIGRWGRQNPVHAVMTIAKESSLSKWWGIVGGLIILTGFLILSYYCVIAGWSIDYVLKTTVGEFSGTNVFNSVGIFQTLVSNPWQLLFWQTIVVIGTGFVIARGIELGIERAVRFMFPMMIIIMCLLIGYAMSTDKFTYAMHWLFYPDISELTPRVMLVALGQAFFSLSIATGTIMTYGAYLPHKASITGVSFAIALTDTLIALLAGIAIFPIVFTNHLTPEAGPGLIFQTLPLAFAHMPFGRLFGTLFFVMLVFAAFTSTISLLEPTVAWLTEQFSWSRIKAVVVAVSIIWLLGLITVFSFNIWAHIKVFGLTLFEALDYLTANIMLPLGGLLAAIFIAWRVPETLFHQELRPEKPIIYSCFKFTMRFIVPIAILLVFLQVIGILSV